jgi:hypothetical protein
MKANQMFNATDKLGRTFLYEYLGINPENGSSHEVILYNHTLQEETLTEKEWFNQRIITTVQ